LAVTSATLVIYGQAVWDPVPLLSRFGSPVLHVVGLVGLGLATLATKPGGPANDLANLWQRRISFRVGALITGVVGVVIQPWRLVEDSSGYIFKWLIAYSALLGVLIADYFLVRRTRLDLQALYQWGGSCRYTGGFHAAGLLAPAAGVIPCVPGSLATVGLVEVMPSWTDLYHSAWSLGFGTSLLVYSGQTLRRPGGAALPRGS
jgi:nucleobase:cation symporter-1, NCS1 family